MASAKERLKILENVIARVGLDGDVIGEYSKAMSRLNGLQTYNELNPPMPPIMQNTPITGQIPQNEGTLPPIEEVTPNPLQNA